MTDIIPENVQIVLIKYFTHLVPAQVKTDAENCLQIPNDPGVQMTGSNLTRLDLAARHWSRPEDHFSYRVILD